MKYDFGAGLVIIIVLLAIAGGLVGAGYWLGYQEGYIQKRGEITLYPIVNTDPTQFTIEAATDTVIRIDETDSSYNGTVYIRNAYFHNSN